MAECALFNDCVWEVMVLSRVKNGRDNDAANGRESLGNGFTKISQFWNQLLRKAIYVPRE